MLTIRICNRAAQLQVTLWRFSGGTGPVRPPTTGTHARGPGRGDACDVATLSTSQEVATDWPSSSQTRQMTRALIVQSPGAL